MRLRRYRRPNLDCVTTRCICGSYQWQIWATFDEDTWDIATYSTDMFCLNCGARADTPTPDERENQ